MTADRGSTDGVQLVEMSVAELVPCRWQPREVFDEDALLELARHIAAHGLMYPVIAFQNERGEYELVAGERRLRASQQALAWTVDERPGQVRLKLELEGGARRILILEPEEWAELAPHLSS